VLFVPVTARGKRYVELTEAQADVLALSTASKLLGCGKMACAYAANDGRVVKLTKDTRDALASYIVSNMPTAGEGWAIPIRAVYRLEGQKYYVIIADLADPLPSPIADAIDWVYDEVGNREQELLKVRPWRSFVSETRAKAEDVSDYDLRESRLAALGAIERAVEGFHRIGLEWLDFHSGNFGVYRDKLVVIDLGLSYPSETVPAETLARVGVEYL
jgi:hypothetical protein